MTTVANDPVKKTNMRSVSLPQINCERMLTQVSSTGTITEWMTELGVRLLALSSIVFSAISALTYSNDSQSKYPLTLQCMPSTTRKTNKSFRLANDKALAVLPVPEIFKLPVYPPIS